MPNEMTAGKSAEKLESMVDGTALYQKETGTSPNCVLLSQSGIEAIKYAASVLRRVASGELAPAPTGFPIEIGKEVGNWKIIGADYQSRTITMKLDGALMDGKDE